MRGSSVNVPNSSGAVEIEVRFAVVLVLMHQALVVVHCIVAVSVGVAVRFVTMPLCWEVNLLYSSAVGQGVLEAYLEEALLYTRC
jgi:hypothetical protein